MPIRLLAPRYWLTWLGLGLLRVIALLPYAALVRMGTVLGAMLLRMPVGFIATARRNMELCLPEMSAVERERLLKRHFESLGISLFETAFTWWSSARALR